jgi:hypothetical protein
MSDKKKTVFDLMGAPYMVGANPGSESEEELGPNYPRCSTAQDAIDSALAMSKEQRQRAALLDEEQRDHPMPPQIVDHENSSVLCPVCGGRAALCSALINEIFPDQEPYVSGVIEDTKSGPDASFDAHASVIFHYCEDCAGIVDAELEDIIYVKAEKKEPQKQPEPQERPELTEDEVIDLTRPRAALWMTGKQLLRWWFQVSPTDGECGSFGSFVKREMPIGLQDERRTDKGGSYLYSESQILWLKENIKKWERYPDLFAKAKMERQGVLDDIHARIAAQDVRRLPFEIHPRAETGALQFKNDWPGLFMRGDSAMILAFHIEQALKDMDDLVTLIGANKLERSQARNYLSSIQQKIFDHVFVGGWRRPESPADKLMRVIDGILDEEQEELEKSGVLLEPVESPHDKMARAMEQVTVQDIATVCKHVIAAGEDSEQQSTEGASEDTPETPEGD